MSAALNTFLQNQKESSPVYFLLSGVTIFGKFDKLEFDRVTLSEVSISSEKVTGQITIPKNSILAWGEGTRRITS